MNTVSRMVAAGSLALVLGLTAGYAAADEKSPEDLAVEGIGQILDAMKVFISTIPMYAAPEILPNGDIIIRRLNPSEGEGDTNPDSSDDDIKT